MMQRRKKEERVGFSLILLVLRVENDPCAPAIPNPPCFR
jgi:hypothetical protein